MKLGIGNTMHQNLFILLGNFVFKLNKKQKPSQLLCTSMHGIAFKSFDKYENKLKPPGKMPPSSDSEIQVWQRSIAITRSLQ